MENGYYMLRVSHINRASRNIVACASYRSDEKLFSERTQENIQFRKHNVKPEAMILTPEHAPEWAKDRATLWNQVDRNESRNKKTDSPRLATEVLISLPNDLDRNVQTELARTFVEDEFVSRGMIADVCIHRDDSNNPHAHILLTIRPIHADGTWGKKTQTRTRYDENGNAVLNKNGNKVREQIRFAELDLNILRKNWEEKLNEYAQREESSRVYDARSFKDQGRTEMAQIHLTREEYRIEKREQKRCEKAGINYQPVTFYGQLNHEIKQYNEGILTEIKVKEEQIQKRNIFNQAVESAKQVVHFDEKAKAILDKRYKYDAGYIEAKETLNHMHNMGSTFGRKINNDLLKNILKANYYKELIEKHQSSKESVSAYGYDPDNFKKDMTEKIKALKEERATLMKRKEMRDIIYASAKTVMNDHIQLNNKITEMMYPTNHDKFTHDEKAFIVNEAHKGHVMKATEVQNAFRNSQAIPPNMKHSDAYLKASRDIFFADREIKKFTGDKRYDAIETVIINRLFMDNKLEELQSYEPSMDDQLMNVLPDNYAQLTDVLDVYSKSQLLTKIESIDDRNDHQAIVTIIRNHLTVHEDVHDSKSYPEQRNSSIPYKNMINDLLYGLSIYVNNEYYEGNLAKKKKKKKNQYYHH